MIRARRGGSASEVAEFLTDLNAAYNCLYSLSLLPLLGAEESISRRVELLLTSGRFPPSMLEEFLMLNDFLEPTPIQYSVLNSEQIDPNFRLEVGRISISSPGFWEFIGGLNPLEQIRQYLKERHERRKDRDYREESEKDRLRLENEILEQTVTRARIENARERLSIMREFGRVDLDERHVQQLTWSAVGPPMSKLGTHQDKGLIGGPIEESSEQKY